MPKNKKPKSKDFASKNTMNPPAPGGPPPNDKRAETVERRVGQYGEMGVPPLMKK